MTCRDWLSTLWPASYRGFSFWFESDDEEGGRGLVVHEFPKRDAPFVEDMGEAPRYFEGRAYIAGDDADRRANEFATLLAARGPATLVVPVRGPVLVHAQTFRRHHERDRLGFIAFQVKFVRDGFATALVPVSFAAGAAFTAADQSADAIAAATASALRLVGEPDHVAQAATDTLAQGLAALDHVRETWPVDPVASAPLRDRLADALAALPGALADDALAVAAETVAMTRALADAIAPDEAARAMRDLAVSFAYQESAARYPSRTSARAAANEAAIARLVRLSAMTAFSEAVLRRAYRSRPDGITARAEVAERFDREVAGLSGAADYDLYVALTELQGRVVDYLSRVVTDLAPVIVIEAARAMPSLYWAYRLYGDPARSGELVARNLVRHPAFMPERFAALAR